MVGISDFALSIAKKHHHLEFQIEKLLIDNTSISLVSRLLQIQKKCSRLDPYNNTIPLFVSESTTKDYSKYDKMLKLGIPLMGVKQKMTLDGLDDTDTPSFNQNGNYFLQPKCIRKCTTWDLEKQQPKLMQL